MNDRKKARSYNILTYIVGAWRKYLDKRKRKAAKRFALDEEMKAWQQAAAEAYWRFDSGLEQDPECICGLIIPNREACQCGCGCCPEERGG